MTLLVNIWNDTAVLGVTGPHFFPLFSFRNDPNCWWRDGFQVRQWEPGTLLDLLKATSVKALSTSSLQKLLNLHWLRLTHRLLKLEFNDSSASSLKSMVLEGCVSTTITYQTWAHTDGAVRLVQTTGSSSWRMPSTWPSPLLNQMGI